jgi:hypothetical protein
MTVARLVIAIGTKRERARRRSPRPCPSPREARLASSTSRMPFDTAIPMTIRIPMSAVIEKPCPAAISASTIPTSETGIVKSMTNGSRSDLNCDAMIMNTTITASPSARPSPENVVRISSTWPTNDVVDVARPRVAPSAASRSRAAAADVAPSVCMRRGRRARGGCARRRSAPPRGGCRRSAEEHRLPSGVAHAHGQSAASACGRRPAPVVVGDDVVRLAVVGVDPDAGRVDVAERRLERRLRGVARVTPTKPAFSRSCRRGSPGSRARASRGSRRGRRGRCARRRRSPSPALELSRLSPRTSTTSGAV